MAPSVEISRLFTDYNTKDEVLNIRDFLEEAARIMTTDFGNTSRTPAPLTWKAYGAFEEEKPWHDMSNMDRRTNMLFLLAPPNGYYNVFQKRANEEFLKLYDWPAPPSSNEPVSSFSVTTHEEHSFTFSRMPWYFNSYQGHSKRTEPWQLRTSVQLETEVFKKVGSGSEAHFERDSTLKSPKIPEVEKFHVKASLKREQPSTSSNAENPKDTIVELSFGIVVRKRKDQVAAQTLVDWEKAMVTVKKPWEEGMASLCHPQHRGTFKVGLARIFA